LTGAFVAVVEALEGVLALEVGVLSVRRSLVIHPS
jgi:hypothetical protein